VHEVQRLLEVLPGCGHPDRRPGLARRRLRPVCWKFCPDVAIRIDDQGWPVVDYDHCKGCGICEVECAPRAITMEKEEL